VLDAQRGEIVGLLLGEIDGTIVGLLLDISLGEIVGLLLGEIDGKIVGLVLGTTLAVGAKVGMLGVVVGA